MGKVKLPSIQELTQKTKNFFGSKIQQIKSQAQALPQYTQQTPIAQNVRNFLNKPVQSNVATRGLVSAARPLQQPLQQFGTGFTQASTYGLASPKTQPITNFGEALGYGVGFGAGMLNPLNPVNKFGIWNKLGQIGGRPAQALVSKIAPKATGFVAKKLIPSIGSEVAQSLAYGGASKLVGKPFNFTTDLAMGVGMRGLGKFQPDLPVSKFKVSSSTYDELIDAERRIRQPRKYIDIEAIDKLPEKMRNQSEREAIKQIQKSGRDIVQQIAIKHLPTEDLKATEGNPLKMLKRLVDLNKENKLANMNYLVENKPTQATKGVTKEVGNMPTVNRGLELPKTTQVSLSSPAVRTQPSPLSQTPQTLRTGKLEQPQAFEDIISQGRKQIGSAQSKPSGSIKQTASDIYTQWVDRYNPITKASEKAKGVLKLKGAELRPEADPSVLVRKLTGAGGIADYKYRTELKPVVDQMDNLKIDKLDMDVYLANKRLAGFGEIGREVKGADPIKAKQIVDALEAKYGTDISQLADQLYKYQNKGFQEMIDAGFISPETGKIIRSQNPDYAPLNRVMDEMDNYLGLPTRKTMQGSQPILKLKGSERQIDSPIENIIANTFKQRAAIEKNNVAKSITNLQQIADLGFAKVSKSGNDTITIWNNGNKEYWKVGDEIASTAKGLNEENMNTLLKLFTAPARLLRQGATGRNPEFMIPNIVRDQLDAGITSKYGYIPFVDYISGLKSMVTNDDVYRRWQKSGAKIDLGEMSGRKTIQASFDKTLNKKRLFGWVGSTLDIMGKYSEQPTRVGLFKKAYRKTGNELLAMIESRDSTVDFARMGSKMKVANSIVPFLNVGVQGFDKLIRSTKNNPAKVALNASIYGALPATMVTLYNLANFKEEYAEIPQYEKDSNFVLVKGRNEKGTVDYISIPKGNVLPLISNPIQSFLEFASKNSQQTFGEFTTQLLSSALPVIGDGQSLKEVGVKTIGSNLPQLVKPITENLMNKSFWKYNTDTEQTKEIVPSYLQKKAPYQQSYEWTPKMYKAIGSVLNVSPLQVQNLMEGYLAGYTKVPSQLIDAAFSLSKGEPVDTNQKTILRRFIKETYPSSGKKPVVQQESPGLMDRITGKVSASEGELPTNVNDFKVLYEDAQNKIDGYKDLSSKIRTGLKDTQTLPEAQQELSEAISTVKRMEKEQPEKVYKVGLDVYESSGGKTTLERADWAEKWLNNSKDETQFNSWYEEMIEKEVMTKSVLEELRSRGFKLDKYIEGGKIKTLGGKGKKISFPNTKFTLPKGRQTKLGGVNLTGFKLNDLKLKPIQSPGLNVSKSQFQLRETPRIKIPAKLNYR